jgi:hypothetical protein
MPGTEAFADILEQELKWSRGSTYCWYCRHVPPEMREALDAQVAKGVRKWKAFAAALQKAGVTEASASKLQGHFVAAAADPRHQERNGG